MPYQRFRLLDPLFFFFSTFSLSLKISIFPSNQPIHLFKKFLFFFTGYATFARPRQNSVFVGPQVTVPKPPRKTRSAMDLHSMVEEGPEPV